MHKQLGQRLKSVGKLGPDGALHLLAPAKLNLGLKVLGRRPDGYRELQTVFQLVDLCDRVRIEERTDGKLHLELSGGAATDLPTDSGNLALAAAEALQQRARSAAGASISLHKEIPVGAGLGGGSSDAAAVLAGLNRLWKMRLAPKTLLEIALSLGADVPVFLFGRSAFAGGVGEELTAVHLPQRHYLLAVPQQRLETAGMFARLPLPPPSWKESSASDYLSWVDGDRAENDFLALALDSSEELQQLYQRLEAFGRPRMTGTGTGLFVMFRRAEEVREALRQLPEQIWARHLVGTNRSPLYQSGGETGKI